ncbi:MAG: Panacea domain-containing protein [Xenococcus sp. (in: cyanobacteria)]
MIKTLSCFDIAEYFIQLANDTGSFISNLKLQKLVYYAQAWHLALYDEPLFDEDFEAWVHGPIIPQLYQEYKKFGWHPIEQEAKPDLPSNIKEFLDELALEYFAVDAYELEQMTHIEAPWIKARGNLPPDAASNSVIRQEWIKEYFAKRAEEEEN